MGVWELTWQKNAKKGSKTPFFGVFLVEKRFGPSLSPTNVLIYLLGNITNIFEFFGSICTVLSNRKAKNGKKRPKMRFLTIFGIKFEKIVLKVFVRF